MKQEDLDDKSIELVLVELEKFQKGLNSFKSNFMEGNFMSFCEIQNELKKILQNFSKKLDIEFK